MFVSILMGGRKDFERSSRLSCICVLITIDARQQRPHRILLSFNSHRMIYNLTHSLSLSPSLCSFSRLLPFVSIFHLMFAQGTFGDRNVLSKVPKKKEKRSVLSLNSNRHPPQEKNIYFFLGENSIIAVRSLLPSRVIFLHLFYNFFSRIRFKFRLKTMNRGGSQCLDAFFWCIFHS